jgi:hypothetical protein
LFSLDSLGTYLKVNRFISKHVGLFILRLHFIVVEIELSGKETAGMVFTDSHLSGECIFGTVFM